MNLSREVLENIEKPDYFNNVIEECKGCYAINLNKVAFENVDVTQALNRIYFDLKDKYIFDYLEDYYNCGSNSLKQVYNYYNNKIIDGTEIHIIFQEVFDGEKYIDNVVKIYLNVDNFGNSVELNTVEKIQTVMQKTKDFIYNWHKIKPDLVKDMGNYIARIIKEDERLERLEKEKQEIIAKTEKEDTKFINFCKNFKA